MKARKITVKGIKALSTQRLLELNGFRILSWQVISGRQVVIEYAK